MKYQYFKDKLENIDKMIFNDSFGKELSLQKLSEIYIELLELKEEFLINSFKNNSLKEIEEIRVKLSENILNIRILIKEKRNLNYDIETRKMKFMFN